MFRIAIFMFFWGCALVGDADACDGGTGSVATIFFDNSPQGIEAGIVAKITITDIIKPGVHAPGYVDAIAKVEKVLKGSIDENSIKIVAPANSCTLEVNRGFNGIVAGNIRINATTGEKELFVISESQLRRKKRESLFR